MRTRGKVRQGSHTFTVTVSAAYPIRDNLITLFDRCVTFVHSMKTKFENGISDILSRPRGSQMLNCLVGTLRVLGDSKHPQAGQ